MGNQHGSAVQILTWFLVITLVLGVGARGLTKAIIVRSVSLDDYLITVSLVCSWSRPSRSHSPNGKQVFAIGQSVAVSVEAGHGYGSPSDPLNRFQTTSNLKVSFLLVHETECFD